MSSMPTPENSASVTGGAIDKPGFDGDKIQQWLDDGTPA